MSHQDWCLELQNDLEVSAGNARIDQAGHWIVKFLESTKTVIPEVCGGEAVPFPCDETHDTISWPVGVGMIRRSPTSIHRIVVAPPHPANAVGEEATSVASCRDWPSRAGQAGNRCRRHIVVVANAVIVVIAHNVVADTTSAGQHAVAVGVCTVVFGSSVGKRTESVDAGRAVSHPSPSYRHAGICGSGCPPRHQHRRYRRRCPGRRRFRQSGVPVHTLAKVSVSPPSPSVSVPSLRAVGRDQIHRRRWSGHHIHLHRCRHA